jgi:hypothetical protein
MNEALAQALASIIGYLGAYPILLFLAVMGLGPWVMMIIVSRQQDKRQTKDIQRQIAAFERQDKRFEQVVRMYEDNVALVRSYEIHVSNQRETNDKLIDLVAISTSTQQTLVDYIKNNWWCPVSKDPGLLNLFKERKPL